MSIDLQNVAVESEVENEKFKTLAQRLSVMLAGEGVLVRTYDKGLPYFSKLSEKQKQTINYHLEFYVELCREHMSEGYSLKDGPTFVWRALRKLNLIPRSDLFQFFNENSVIEIYSNENVQLFRNLNFFRVCSYTLEELHSREWWLLFHRDNSITDSLMGYAGKIFNQEISENFVPDIPTHIVRELASADMLVTEINFPVMGPLYHNKRAVALIIAEDAKILEG